MRTKDMNRTRRAASTGRGRQAPPPHRTSRIGTVAALAGVLWMAPGCSFDVLNPGPLEDGLLDHPGAHEGVVNGAGRALAYATHRLGGPVASVTRELIGEAIQEHEVQQGYLPTTYGSRWVDLHEARWIAEDGVRRLREAKGDGWNTSERAVRILLHVGYSNRMLGGNMCDGVIDGGPRQPHTVHLDRAEAAFSEAIEIAQRIGHQEFGFAARAGRAQIRMLRGSWAEAVSDAQQVPTDQVYVMEYNVLEEPQMNNWWRQNQAHLLQWTAWNTPYVEYYPETEDPRVEWWIPDGNPPVSNPLLGVMFPPHLRQMKYTAPDAPINLSSGREMRLIEAEALLRDGDWQAAIGIVNVLRAEVGVAPWAPSSLEEAWTNFKRERGVELWLEGRRLEDFRRWAQDDVPGELHPIEVTGGAIPFNPEQSLCFPIPDSEYDTNPNL